MQEIAAAAEASKLSLYRNFASKQALVAAVLAERSERIHGWLRRETSSAEDGVEPVVAIFELLADWYGQADFRGCAIVNAVSDTRGDGDTEVASLARSHLHRYRELLTERLEHLDPPLVEPRALASQLLLLIEGATVVRAIDGPTSRAGHDSVVAATRLISAADRRQISVR